MLSCSTRLYSVHHSRPAEGTIVAFNVIIGHHSRTDCAKKSLKTSTDLEERNLSAKIKKGTLTFENFEKMEIFDFPEAISEQFWKIQNILHDCLLLFSNSFGLDYVKGPQQTKNANQNNYH